MAFFKIDRITGRKFSTPYMTRIKFGRFRINIFHRGDADPDPHDHPFDFWTLPLRGYYEMYWPCPKLSGVVEDNPKLQFVKPWRIHYRPHSHTHRVLDSSWFGVTDKPRTVITLVWTRRPSNKRRGAWGFYTKETATSALRRYVSWRNYFKGMRTIYDN